MAKAKKIKIPKSVLELKLSEKKFAKKHGITIKGKHMSKKEKKFAAKKLNHEYAEAAINGLNKAVKILAENGDFKKIDKVKAGVENIILNPEIMKRIAKIYKKNPDEYTSLKFLPYMIMNTLTYYKQEGLSDEEKAKGEALDAEALISFCEKILKKEIKRYKNRGLSNEVAFQIATVIPTTKLFKNNRTWYKRLIQTMYDIAASETVDIDDILKAVINVDKKGGITKKEFMEGFFTEFIMQRTSNKQAKFTDNQKDLHEGLIERALVYMNDLKPRKLREMIKTFIKRRKKAEEYKNDGKRVIKFIDHANSNSPYTNIKDCVQSLISDNANNEIYLG